MEIPPATAADGDQERPQGALVTTLMINKIRVSAAGTTAGSAAIQRLRRRLPRCCSSVVTSTGLSVGSHVAASPTLPPSRPRSGLSEVELMPPPAGVPEAPGGGRPIGGDGITRPAAPT